jgi:TolB-like protein/Flp pilus assembly protein TadD
MSGDPEQVYFADGVTDSIILDMARIPSLRVTSRTSVMRYKGTRQSIPEIGEALGVDALIEGTVNREGDRIRVTVQLIDARDDSHLWADQYDREIRGILSLQSEIASAIARRVEAQLTPANERRFSARPPADPVAHEEYLKGLYFAQKHTAVASLRSRDHFEAAMRIDPEYPLPYAGLADTLSCAPMHTWAVPAEGENALPQAVMARAQEMANRAMELDGDLPEAQVALGLVDVFRHQDWGSAERNVRSALELNPSYEFAYRALATVLGMQGRLDEAVVAMERARELDPFSPFVASMAADFYWYGGNAERAVTLWEEATVLDAAHPLGLRGLGIARCESGAVDEAVGLLEEARRLSSDDPVMVADMAHCLARARRSDEARALLTELESRGQQSWVSPMSLALIHVGLGDHEAAIGDLQRAYEVGATFRLLEIGIDRRWDPLRGDPRFAELLSRLGLVSATDSRA